MGAAFKQIDPAAHVKASYLFNDMVSRYPQTRQSDNSMYLCSQRGVLAFGENSTAFPWRQAVGHQSVYLDLPRTPLPDSSHPTTKLTVMSRTWGIDFADNTSTEASIEFLPDQMRLAIAETAGTDGLAAYVGFSKGDESLESLFSRDNLPALAELKTKYDPEGWFNAYHPLPTLYP